MATQLLRTESRLGDVVANVQDHYASLGFHLETNVDSFVDESLRIMGYSSQRDGKPFLVVSGHALHSPMLEGLVAHELGHCFLTQKRHPSHDSRLLEEVASNRAINHSFLHNALNHVQDVYADDVAFPVLGKMGFPKAALQDFFVGWLNPKAGNKLHNAVVAASNAFATANLERHELMDEETSRQVNGRNERFLSASGFHKPFQFFRTFLLTLPEDPQRERLHALLSAYVKEFEKALG